MESLSLKRAQYPIIMVSPFFKDSSDCLIIPWNAITSISISSRFVGALYNHSDATDTSRAILRTGLARRSLS